MNTAWKVADNGLLFSVNKMLLFRSSPAEILQRLRAFSISQNNLIERRPVSREFLYIHSIRIVHTIWELVDLSAQFCLITE